MAPRGILPGPQPFIVIRTSHLFPFFNDRYAAMSRQNDSHLQV